MNDLKQEYLDAKYAMYDDESDTPYRHKRKKHGVKKSKHKHKYENCVIVDPTKDKSFYLVSVCKMCGKIGDVQKDKRIDRKFPHVRYNNICSFASGHEDEFEEFKDWCKENYEVIEMPFDDLWRVKYI